MRRWRSWRWLMVGAGAAVAVLALLFVYRELSRYSLEAVLAAMRDIPVPNLALAALFVALSYLTLTLFDTLGIRYAGRHVPYPRIALASFCSLSIGHNVGFAALSSGALRLRFYSRAGLGVGDVARVILFCAATVGLGLLALAAAVLLIGGPSHELGLTPATARLLGAACLAPLVAYLALCTLATAPLRAGRWSVPVPPFRLALAQIAVGLVNFAFVTAALWQSLAAATGARYADVVVGYVMGVVAALVSHVPGGLGVIEAAVLFVVPGAGAIGGLVLFRVLYYLVPLLLGILALGASEVLELRSRRRGGSPKGGGGSRRGTGIGFGGSSIGGGAPGSGGGGSGGFTGGCGGI
ncbi:MAG: UPF0104 family protein [Rhodospirillales bacterium]|nr:UPF0104 family protein [Rhodospirillales bacterium]